MVSLFDGWIDGWCHSGEGGVTNRYGGWLETLDSMDPHCYDIFSVQILNTPYGSSNHAYVDAGPFNDPDLKPIMGRMGFSLSSTQKLLHTYRDSEAEEDMLAAAFILMLASE